MSPIDAQILHTTGTLVSGDFTKGKRVFKSEKNNDVLPCSVDNTTDTDKPVSTAQAQAIAACV